MNRHFKTFQRILVLGGATLLLSGPALADEDDMAEARAIAGAAGLISIEQATEHALKAKPGTVIEVELDKRSWPQGWDYGMWTSMPRQVKCARSGRTGFKPDNAHIMMFSFRYVL